MYYSIKNSICVVVFLGEKYKKIMGISTNEMPIIVNRLKKRRLVFRLLDFNVFLLLELMTAPCHPQRSCDAQGCVTAAHNTHHHGKGETDDRSDACNDRHYSHRPNGHKGRGTGEDGTSKRLVDTPVDHFADLGLRAHQTAVLTDTVVDNDGTVDGVTQDGQDNCDKVIIHRDAGYYKHKVNNGDIMQQGDNGHDTGRDTADLTETDANVQDQENSC